MQFVFWEGHYFIISRVNTKKKDVRYLISVELSMPRIQEFFSHLFSLQSIDANLYTDDGQLLKEVTDYPDRIPNYLTAIGTD